MLAWPRRFWRLTPAVRTNVSRETLGARCSACPRGACVSSPCPSPMQAEAPASGLRCPQRTAGGPDLPAPQPRLSCAPTPPRLHPAPPTALRLRLPVPQPRRPRASVPRCSADGPAFPPRPQLRLPPRASAPQHCSRQCEHSVLVGVSVVRRGLFSLAYSGPLDDKKERPPLMGRPFLHVVLRWLRTPGTCP